MKTFFTAIAILVTSVLFVAAVSDFTAQIRTKITEPCAVVTVNQGEALCVTQSGTVRVIKQR